MFYSTDDLRIKWIKVVLPPVFLEEELPTTEKASATVHQAREQIATILNGDDPRLLVIVGPCSIHDTKAAREYAALLKQSIDQHANELRIVMRVYFEKPRTTIGWKGLINDPHLDQSYKINDGLRQARHLLLDLAEMGVPAGTEFLDMITPQYLGGTGELGSDRRAHNGEPNSSPIGVGPVMSGGLQECDLRRCADRHRSGAVCGAPAHLSRTHEARAIGDLRYQRQSGLPRDSARRPQPG